MAGAAGIGRSAGIGGGGGPGGLTGPARSTAARPREGAVRVTYRGKGEESALSSPDGAVRPGSALYWVAAAAKACIDGNSQSGVKATPGSGVAPQPGRS